jgi:hypothetical protein
MVEKELSARADQFAAHVASFVASKLFDEQIVPRLESFRAQGGKIADLKSELTLVAEAFLPRLQSYIADCALPEFQSSLSRRLGEILKSVGTSFVEIDDPQKALRNLPIPGADGSQLKISNEFGRAIGVSIGTSIALAVAAIAGGIGEELGIAIVATVLGTTGPVGFLIGLVGGAVAAAGAWWLGKEKVNETVENIFLPAPVLRAALWPSRFQRMLGEARQNCEDSVRASVDERLQSVFPKIISVILGRLRGLWPS